MGAEHHVHRDDGTFIGLYTIDPQKARKQYGFWEGITEIVREYSRLHPEEMRTIAHHNELTKRTNKDEFGANTAMTLRHCLSLPFGLLNFLEEYEPTLFANKKTRHEFMRRFPALRSCQSV